MFIEGAFYIAELSTNPANYFNPITTTITVADKAYQYLKPQQKIPSALPAKTLEKFKKWEKEDWIKDDPYKEMWDPNWISK
jgi:hypothetical protein